MNAVVSFLRLTTFGVVGLVAVALGIGLASPDIEAVGARRILDPTVLVQLPFDREQPRAGGPCWFDDPTTGRRTAMPLPEGETLEKASLSPWRDERGGRQAIGRWHRFSAIESDDPSRDFGMALFCFPDGRRLKVFPMNLTPSDPPCWSPFGDPEILFPAADGRLYSLSIGGDGPDSPVALRTSRGIPWRGRPQFSDLRWPADPRFGGRLFVSIRFLESTTMQASNAELWWLRLSADHAIIVDAGPITLPDDRILDGQYPEVAALGDGRMTLAFLAEHEGLGRFDLAVAPLTFSPVDDAPRVGSATVLAEGCFPTRPAFSSDGNAITYVSQTQPGAGLRPSRIDLATVLGIAADESAAQASSEAPAL